VQCCTLITKIQTALQHHGSLYFFQQTFRDIFDLLKQNKPKGKIQNQKKNQKLKKIKRVLNTREFCELSLVVTANYSS
jgi:hypothetical protein